MTTLTGFIPHKDTYYVDGATIKFCMGVHTIYKIIFPDLEIWERELDIYKGDDWKGSHHFLCAIIHYLTKWILKYVVLWVNAFTKTWKFNSYFVCLVVSGQVRIIPHGIEIKGLRCVNVVVENTKIATTSEKIMSGTEKWWSKMWNKSIKKKEFDWVPANSELAPPRTNTRRRESRCTISSYRVKSNKWPRSSTSFSRIKKLGNKYKLVTSCWKKGYKSPLIIW